MYPDLSLQAKAGPGLVDTRLGCALDISSWNRPPLPRMSGPDNWAGLDARIMFLLFMVERFGMCHRMSDFLQRPSCSDAAMWRCM